MGPAEAANTASSDFATSMGFCFNCFAAKNAALVCTGREAWCNPAAPQQEKGALFPPDNPTLQILAVAESPALTPAARKRLDQATAIPRPPSSALLIENFDETSCLKSWLLNNATNTRGFSGFARVLAVLRGPATPISRLRCD